MNKKMKKDLRDLRTTENSKFMNLMMTAMMMTNYNSMVSTQFKGLSLPKKQLDEKNTPTSILQELGIIPSENNIQDRFY